MINPRLLMQLPLFLLGSCTITPHQPGTSVYVYTNNGQPSEVRSFDSHVNQFGRPALPDMIICKVSTVKEAQSYQLPARPVFSDIPDGDDQAVADRIIQSNEQLRQELRDKQEELLCALNQIANSKNTHK